MPSFKKLNIPSASDQPALWWVIRAVLIVYAAVVANSLPENVAAAFDHVAVRLVAALLVVFCSLYDPASAILLAVGFVVSVQTHNQYHIARMANGAVSGNTGATADTTVASEWPPSRKEGFEVLPDAESADAENAAAGAESLAADPSAFSTEQHIADAQSNHVGGDGNQQTEVRTWTEGMGPQGLGPVTGTDQAPQYHSFQ